MGTSAQEIRDFVAELFKSEGLALQSVAQVASIEHKKDEKGLQDFAEELGVPFAGTDMAYNNTDTFRSELGRNVGRNLRLALVIQWEELDLHAENSAISVDFSNQHFSSFLGRNTVGSQVTGVRTGNTNLDRICHRHTSKRTMYALTHLEKTGIASNDQ